MFRRFYNDKTTSAVVRKIEIISEAVKQLPVEAKNRFQEIPWNLMAKTRDKIIHFYHGIDYEIIWKIIKDDLPPILSRLKQIYELLQKEEK